MSIGPTTVPAVMDLFRGTSGSNADVAGLGTTTGTAAYGAVVFPPGKKAVQISFVTSATAQITLQNSIDRVTWFNVVVATNTSSLYEIDSVVPSWRINVTSHATSGTGAGAAMTAQMCQVF